jgi:hypothetical protein
MGYEYEYIDGHRVEKNVAKAFRKMAAAFFLRWGLLLLISSATRTRAEQTTLWNRWVAWLNGTGPRANLAAPPGMSNHEESGPRGPRALDLRDSGRDDGVTVIGSERSNWLAANAHRWGFTPAGHSFVPKEGWHYEYTGSLFKRVVAAVASVVKKVTGPKPSAMLKWRWVGIQRMLKRHYGYTGRIDNIPGASTIRAFQRFLNTKGYARRAIGRNLIVDGRFGANTCKGAQQWLKDVYGYLGKIDALPGAGTKAAWDVAEKRNDAAFR